MAKGYYKRLSKDLLRDRDRFSMTIEDSRYLLEKSLPYLRVFNHHGTDTLIKLIEEYMDKTGVKPLTD